MDELVLAYATTIHKAQGSEYPIVVMPVTMSHYIMLQRNLIYTGITRAKKILVMVGTRKALSYAIRNVTVHKRNTMLRERLEGILSGRDQRELSFQNPETVLKRLTSSEFRNRFQLTKEDIDYINDKGLDKIKEHAQDIVAKRLAPEDIPNDGKQTPMRGHPVFIAQHATACCCRGCLLKWHRIAPGHELTSGEQVYIVDVVMEWISRQYKKGF